MDTKTHSDLQEQLTAYIVGKKLRKTEERYTILQQISEYPGHFDIISLHEKLESLNFHVSKATLYNNLNLFIEAGLIVRHFITPQNVQYELRSLAETHQHLICTYCGDVKEIRNQALKTNACNLKLRRFTPEFSSLYIYGTCSRCTYRMNRDRRKREKQETQKKIK
ncbi:MAG: transcriptional repressor [Tannerellaceae bacterium]|nr:transcriptional repressor [Tannerellaceae bacterium]